MDQPRTAISSGSPGAIESSRDVAKIRAPRDVRACAHRCSLPWPDDLLVLFSLGMASHGMSISRVDMTGDPRYALQQLIHARDMGDARLSLIADQLFRFFEAHQSGLAAATH